MSDEINKMQTPDLNKERLETLKKLFPDLFTIEGKLNPDELHKIVEPELTKETERYEFKWFGKSEAKRIAFTPSKATLKYDEDRSVNPEQADGNMIIEGENLETLKCLLKAYREKIKCIYIDPPYNKGKDFVYSDKWDESKESYWEHIGVTKDGVKIDTNADSSGRYHSNWLNMMYSRLLIARQLLKEDGVIFISIDDTEVHHLRKICDEVFGEDNFRNILYARRYDKNVNRQFIENGLMSLNVGVEMILCYSKSFEFKFNPIFREADQDRATFGYWKGFWNNANRPTMRYEILGHTPDSGQWKWEKERTKRAIENYKKYVSEFENNETLEEYWERTGKILEFVRRNENGKGKNKGVEHWIAPSNQILRNTLFSDLFASKSTNGINEIFNFPKNPELLKTFVNSSLQEYENDIIIDFFSGSGTTGEAVMELNKEDGGNRKFILVQIPELTDEKSEAYKAGYIKISDITIERNKRVIKKLEKEFAEKPDLFADKEIKLGFKVYKLAKSNFPRVDFTPDTEKTEEENLEALKKYIQEKEAAFINLTNTDDVMDEVLLKNGFKLNYTKEKIKEFTKNDVYFINDDENTALLCLDNQIIELTLKELQKYSNTKFICLEQALNTQMKWNLKQLLGDYLVAF